MLSFSLPVHKNWWLSLCKLSFEAGSFVNSGEFSYFCVYRLQVYLSQTMQRGCGFRLYWRLAVWKNDVSWWGDHEDIASCRSGNVITFEWAVWLSACAAVYKLSLHVHMFFCDCVVRANVLVSYTVWVKSNLKVNLDIFLSKRCNLK